MKVLKWCVLEWHMNDVEWNQMFIFFVEPWLGSGPKNNIIVSGR